MEKLWQIGKRIILVFSVIVLGTIIDWFAHQTSERFAVPPEYFPHKVLYGTFWGVIAIFLLPYFTKNPRWQAFWMAFSVALVLQIKYFYLGFDLFFVILFFFLHGIMFFIPGWFLFKKYEKVINGPNHTNIK